MIYDEFIINTSLLIAKTMVEGTDPVTIFHNLNSNTKEELDSIIVEFIDSQMGEL